MIGYLVAAKALVKCLPVIVEALTAAQAAERKTSAVTPPVCCGQCGDTPFIVRWGAIRIGQCLDGYYYLATADGEPDLLCRDCWQAALEGGN